MGTGSGPLRSCVRGKEKAIDGACVFSRMFTQSGVLSNRKVTKGYLR